ncbi:hypothetical protein J1N35_011656 [Gossypium stocksii]|uniref:Uncharacterized protein n=1 Tax=Gossypium stocksii TaxID=47602 RepID=A0A9D3W3W3_9ROSI|nr:hypothetical protein J1N35_011656 [Gossypium stocksii]
MRTRLKSKENDTLEHTSFRSSKFEWTSYKDPTNREVIPDKFFVNSNIWHLKVPLVVYATIKMHKID